MSRSASVGFRRVGMEREGEREGGRVCEVGVLIWLSFGSLVFVIGTTCALVRVGVWVRCRVRLVFLGEWWWRVGDRRLELGWRGLVGTRVGRVPAVVVV
jgi:hypothetical protein